MPPAYCRFLYSLASIGRGIFAVIREITFAMGNTSSERRPPVLLVIVVDLLEMTGALISISQAPSEEGET